MFAGLCVIDFKVLLQLLYDMFGIERLMVAGGGITNWSFVQEELLDELSILVAPVADGSTDAVTIFEKADFFSPRSPAVFSLSKVEVIENNTLWLRYTAAK